MNHSFTLTLLPLLMQWISVFKYQSALEVISIGEGKYARTYVNGHPTQAFSLIEEVNCQLFRR